jgi:hypothetical protein
MPLEPRDWQPAPGDARVSRRGAPLKVPVLVGSVGREAADANVAIHPWRSSYRRRVVSVDAWIGLGIRHDRQWWPKSRA